MFAPDVRFEGFSAEDWSLLGALFQPSASGPDGAEASPSGGVIAVTQGSRLSKLLHSQRGRIPLTEHAWRGDLEGLAKEHHANWVLAIHGSALSEVANRFATKLRREDHLLRQLLVLLGVLKELEAEGAFELWPQRVAEWPIPTESIVQKALNGLCATGKVAVVGVFHEGLLETCIAARRSTTGFDWICGPALLREEMGLLSGDFRRDYQHLVGAIENKLGPLGVGCFGEKSVLRALIHHPAPGAWASAVASRDIIVSPLAPAIALPLGVDAGRAALTLVRALAGQLEKSEWFGMRSQLAPKVEKLSDFASSQFDLGALVGFDPIAFLRTLLGGGRASRHPRDSNGPKELPRP